MTEQRARKVLRLSLSLKSAGSDKRGNEGKRWRRPTAWVTERKTAATATHTDTHSQRQRVKERGGEKQAPVAGGAATGGRRRGRLYPFHPQDTAESMGTFSGEGRRMLQPARAATMGGNRRSEQGGRAAASPAPWPSAAPPCAGGRPALRGVRWPSKAPRDWGRRWAAEGERGDAPRFSNRRCMHARHPGLRLHRDVPGAVSFLSLSLPSLAAARDKSLVSHRRQGGASSEPLTRRFGSRWRAAGCFSQYGHARVCVGGWVAAWPATSLFSPVFLCCFMPLSLRHSVALPS